MVDFLLEGFQRGRHVSMLNRYRFRRHQLIFCILPELLFTYQEGAYLWQVLVGCKYAGMHDFAAGPAEAFPGYMLRHLLQVHFSPCRLMIGRDAGNKGYQVVLQELCFVHETGVLCLFCFASHKCNTFAL